MSTTLSPKLVHQDMLEVCTLLPGHYWVPFSLSMGSHGLVARVRTRDQKVWGSVPTTSYAKMCQTTLHFAVSWDTQLQWVPGAQIHGLIDIDLLHWHPPYQGKG